MRSYLDIFIDVQDGKDVDKEELRVALLFCRDMLFFAEQDVKHLIECIEKKSSVVSFQANIARENLESRFYNKKAPLEKWWGNKGIPPLKEKESK